MITGRGLTMKGLNYNKIHKYIVTAVCDGPLHIGSSVGGAEEVLIHPVMVSHLFRPPALQAYSAAVVIV